MGKSILRTWTDQQNNLRGKTIYWGNNESFCDPITNPRYSRWLKRDTQGLSIHILGLHHMFDDDWHNTLATLIKNFYVAISQNMIQFSIGGEEKLNKVSLKSEVIKLNNTFESRETKDKELKDIEFLDALEKPSSDTTIEISDVGKFNLKVVVDEKLKKYKKNPHSKKWDAYSG